MKRILLAGAFLLSWTLIMALIAAAASAQVAPADTVLGPGPGGYRLDSASGTVRIPFEMFRQDIRMLAEINGHPVRLLVDNGHLWDDLLFFGSARVDSLGLVRKGRVDVSGSGEGDPVMADLAENVTVTFPGIEFTGQGAVITDYDPSLPNLWEGAEGQVSAAFFKHFVVSVDFDAGIITLTEPGRFAYEGDGREVALLPLPKEAWAVPAVIELTDGRVITADLMMDLGDGGALSIMTGGPHGIQPPDGAIAARLGFGIQGPITGHIGRIRGVTIGGFRLDNLLADFIDGGGAATDDHTEIMVGMEIFSRFNLHFDYPGRRLILEPNRHNAEPMEYDMSGLFLLPGSEGGWAVERILPDSPGAEAGLVVGDLITAIDGRPAAEFRFWELKPLLRREGAPLRLQVRRGGQPEREVRLILRRLL